MKKLNKRSDLSSSIRHHAGRAGAGLVLVAVSGVAAATEPSAVQTAFTSLQTSAQEVLDAAWPVVTMITLGFIGIKLFRKGANKAT